MAKTTVADDSADWITDQKALGVDTVGPGTFLIFVTRSESNVKITVIMDEGRTTLVVQRYLDELRTQETPPTPGR